MGVCPKCQKSYAEGVTTCPDDGEVLRPLVAEVDRELKRGETIGEYVIEGRLGSGTFGDVYRAIQPLIGKQVAIKLLSRKYSVDPNIVSRFIAEARAVNQIRHKNIIDIFSFGQIPDGRHYHIMELLDGKTLEDHLRARGRIPVGEAVMILRALGKALDAAHAAGIAHRDLKPANVFISKDEDGRPFPKLLDFGIAKLMSDDVPRLHQTATGAAVGTPDYMSPEQCQGPDVDHRTDIYAFGIMTYQLLTGQLPFTGANVVEVLVKQMTAKAVPPSKLLPELPESLDAPILWMLEKDKTKRPANLAAAVRALEEGAKSAGVSIPLTSTTGDPTATPAIGKLPQVAQSSSLPPPAGPSAPPADASGSEATLKSGTPVPVPRSTSPLDDPLLADTVTSASKSASPTRRFLLAFAVFAVLAAFPLGSYLLRSDKEPIAKAEVEAARVAPAKDDPKAEPETRGASPEVGSGPDRMYGGAQDVRREPQKVDPPAEPTAKADTPSTINLVVHGQPQGIEVYAPGGVLLGKAPCTVQIARGSESLKLEFRAAGYLTGTKEIVPIADGEIEIALKKKTSAKGTSKKKPSSDDIENAF